MNSGSCSQMRSSCKCPIECVRTCDQESYLFIETKDSICIKKEFNSHRINLLLQYGGLFIVHSSNMADMT